jgi:hypothetical protein
MLGLSPRFLAALLGAAPFPSGAVGPRQLQILVEVAS